MEQSIELTTEQFETGIAPKVLRIFGNPGYDAQYYSADKDTRVISSKWSIAHWRVHTHWRVAHWRVAMWKDTNYIESPLANPPVSQLAKCDDIILADDVTFRNEKFGKLAFKQGDVFAINKAGEKVLTHILETNDIDNYLGDFSIGIFQEFVSDLFSIGILEMV